MTSSHGRRIQSRRALAILTWVTLVVVAGLLWYGQEKKFVRVQAWEPASLLLSAYATFLSIFGWLLFSPGRKSAEESPALFFSGILTLIPPCFIAYHLMPVGSPLKPWLTIGVFLFGMLAIMSPLPDEVFAVPRSRRSYLQPLTNSYLSELDTSEPQVSFDNLAPRTSYWLSRPSRESEPPISSVTQDPWADPFYGTGRQMSRIGASQSRRSEDASGPDRRRLADEKSAVDSYRPAPRPEMRPPSPLPSVDSPRIASPTWIPPTPSVAAVSTASTSRRPLSEPLQRSLNPVGFQTPVPPPLPVSAFPNVAESPVSLVPPAFPSALETPIPAKSSLRELDRQLRELESQEEPELGAHSGIDGQSADTGSIAPATGITRSVQQSSADVRLERIRDEHGGEMIEGTIGVFFEIGQKRAHLHVPFSPPLPGLPEVECEPAGEDSIRVRVAVRQPYGIRIEARRSEASEALRTEVSFAAVYTPSSRRG